MARISTEKGLMEIKSALGESQPGRFFHLARFPKRSA
jgi:hypothetical protein